MPGEVSFSYLPLCCSPPLLSSFFLSLPLSPFFPPLFTPPLFCTPLFLFILLWIDSFLFLSPRYLPVTFPSPLCFLCVLALCLLISLLLLQALRFTIQGTVLLLDPNPSVPLSSLSCVDKKDINKTYYLTMTSGNDKNKFLHCKG